jgi:hypothetical protein
MLAIDLGDAATWAAAAIAFTSAFAARKSSRLAEEQQKEISYQSRIISETLEKGHELKLREWTDHYFNSVRVWAEEVCMVISEATHFSEDSEVSGEHKRSALIKLSSLVDTGRWYFPNQWSDDYGIHKEPAYRGVRQPVLDCVVDAYNFLKEPGAGREAKSELVKCQREFVSHIQEVLDPRRREQEIKKTLSKFEVSECLRMAPGKR